MGGGAAARTAGAGIEDPYNQFGFECNSSWGVVNLNERDIENISRGPRSRSRVGYSTYVPNPSR